MIKHKITQLSQEQKTFMCRMSGEGYDSGQIRKELRNKWGIYVDTPNICSYLGTKSAKILTERFKKDYLAKVKEVPIANKRIRIDDLEKIRLKILETINGLPLKTKSSRAELSSLTKRLTEVLATARDEMERKPNLVAGVVMGAMGDRSDAELKEREAELLAKILRNERGGAYRVSPDTGGAESENQE